MLVARSRLGPYEILAPLGADGVDEVYWARDTRLKRQFAEGGAADAERIAVLEKVSEG